MSIFLARRWRQQPQGAVDVDWGNSLTRDAWAVYHGASGRFVHSKLSARYVQADMVAGRAGVAPRFGSSYGQAYARTGAFANGSAMTIATVTHYLEAPGIDYFGGIVDPDSLGNRLPTLMTAGAGPGIQYNDGSTKNINTTGAVSSGEIIAQVTRYNPATTTVDVTVRRGSGSRQYVSATATSFLYASGTNAHFAIGRGSNFTTAQHTNPVALFASRAWSDAEAEAFVDNPWQLFRPLRPIVYSLPSSVPVLSSPTVIDIGQTSARPRVTITI